MSPVGLSKSTSSVAMRERRISILSFTAAVSCKSVRQKELSNKGLRTNLALIIDGGDGFQGTFEGTKRFGCRLGNAPHNYGTPKGPVLQISLRNWWGSTST